MNFRTRYSDRVRVTSNTEGVTRTKQAFKDECDVNIILSKYQKSGILPYMRAGGSYGDFSQVSDYQTALNTINQAEEAFRSLPSKLRARLHNDPAEFLQFVQDPANEEELIKYGLASRRVKEGSQTDPATQGAGDTGAPSTTDQSGTVSSDTP